MPLLSQNCQNVIAERVARGGHNIQSETIERRYFRSVGNLLGENSVSCTSMVCIDNSVADAHVIFTQRGDIRTIEDVYRFECLKAEGES